MLYCEKCRRVCPEGVSKCPACRGQRLRPVGEQDMVFLCQCGLYTAQLLHSALEEAGIPQKMEGAGRAYFSFDSESMPTDQRVYVPFAQLNPAKELAAQVGRQVEAEGGNQEDTPQAAPPSPRRIAAEVASVVGFLVLVMLAVYGADGFANWLKSLLGG